MSLEKFGFYIPENLDLKSITNLSDEEIDKLHYLLNLIYEQRVLYRVKTEYVPLKAIYLRKVLRDHKPYREILERLGIIACDYHFIKNKKSFGLKILPPWSDVKCKKVLCSSIKIKKRVERSKESRAAPTKIHRRLKMMLNDIDIDAAKAFKHIENHRIEKYNSDFISIEKIQNRDLYFVTDEYGRVHTNVTTLSQDLRTYLNVQGKKLVNVDIINSQPLFLFLLLQREISSVYTIRCTLSRKARLELDLYQILVESGQLYDFMSFWYQEKNRSKVKEMTFRDIFGPAVSIGFQQAFPLLAEVLMQIKGSDYRRVAWMLQREESKLIISNVCANIISNHPECFLTTIHDSILTTVDQSQIVVNGLISAFKEIGLSPSLRCD